MDVLKELNKIFCWHKFDKHIDIETTNSYIRRYKCSKCDFTFDVKIPKMFT